MRLAWPPALRYVDPRRCDLPRKFLAYSGRGAGNERPRTESFLVNLSFHERVFLLRFKARFPFISVSLVGYARSSSQGANPILKAPRLHYNQLGLTRPVSQDRDSLQC